MKDLSSLLSRRLILTLTSAVLLGLMPRSAIAQSYPERPIRLIVPFAAGGGSDSVGRVIADRLSHELGQPVIVENRPGAGGSIGAAQVAKAAPDGYTLLLGSTSELAQYPHVSGKVPYDPQTDFAPISLVGTVSLVLTVSSKLPIKDVEELIAYARKNPGKLNYGSAGTGSSTHLAMALFAHLAKVEMLNISYKGSAPVVTDLLAGNIDLAMPTMSAVLPHIKSDRLRVIGVSTAEPSVILPDVEVIGSVLSRYEAGLWTGLLAPAGTPNEIIDKLHGAVAKALSEPKVQTMLISQGAEATGSSPAVFAAQIKRENAVWSEVVKQTGIRIK